MKNCLPPFRVNPLLLFCLICSSFAFGQGQQIKIEHADALKGGNSLPGDAKRLIGNVRFRHEGALLSCDSSWYFPKTNRLEAFGNVRIEQGDTLDLTGSYLEYSGSSKKATVTGNVELIDKDMTLRTDRLDYDRKNQVGYYTNGGKIVDPDNTLTSNRGTYYSRSKQFFFSDSVVLVNEEYTMYSDTLLYNTRTKRADFEGNTEIVADSNKILCRKGWYNTSTNLSSFYNRATLIQGEQRITADTLYYDRNASFGKALGRVVVADSLEGISLFGDYGTYEGRQKRSRLGGVPYMAIQTESDSLFVHSDTLIFFEKDSFKGFNAFEGVRFYQSDLQGISDSLSYSERDSLMHFIQNPMLWADGQQLTADTMFAQFSDGSIRKLFMRSRCILIAPDTLNDYNQIQGKVMDGFFKDNRLKRIEVEGNAQSIFFAREEDGGFIGLDLAKSSRMSLRFKDSELDRIVYGSDVEAVLKPKSEIYSEDRKLEHFEWRADWQPKSKASIFIFPVKEVSLEEIKPEGVLENPELPKNSETEKEKEIKTKLD